LVDRLADSFPDHITIRLGRAWQPATEGQGRQRALAAFEWGTLFALRVALRNGSVFLAHSFAFRSQAALLISASDWKAKRNHFFGHLKLPQDAQAFLAPVIAHLDEGLAKLRDAVLCGKLKIDDAVHIDPLVASATPTLVETLRRALFERHPGGELPEILLEIDSATHFRLALGGEGAAFPQRIAIGLRSHPRAWHVDVGCRSRPNGAGAVAARDPADDASYRGRTEAAPRGRSRADLHEGWPVIVNILSFTYLRLPANPLVGHLRPDPADRFRPLAFDVIAAVTLFRVAAPPPLLVDPFFRPAFPQIFLRGRGRPPAPSPGRHAQDG